MSTDPLVLKGYKLGQMLCANETNTSLSETEEKVVEKIRSIRDRIYKRKRLIKNVNSSISELENKLTEWQDVCPHPSISIQYGPQGDLKSAPIESKTCCVCMKQIST